jgi:beta-N-acetylhexosaminidase
MKPTVVGLSGTELTPDEAAVLADHQPLGVILFRRNIEAQDQVLRLCDSVREILDSDGPALWVDQEGGRVQRLTEPHWEKLPAAAAIGALWSDDQITAEYAAWLSGRIIADQCRTAGFDVACAPVLDLSFPETHQVIGDRAFGSEPISAATLARAQAEGLLAGGILPVSKHWPGHGRATVDSHEDLPRVTTSRADLMETDLESFRLAADCAPIAMTGHLVFDALDPSQPSTLSATVIEETIRDHCGFEGFLVSDDLDMKALNGGRGDLARQALKAGCDGVLQCSGNLSVMRDVLEAIDPISKASLERWKTSISTISSIDDVDRHQLLNELRDVIR